MATVAPEGFVAVPGTERPGGAVFDVERAGVRSVCKRLPPRARDEAWMRARLAAEAELLAELAGRGAPRLVARGADAHGPWLVMERVGWPSLAEHAGRVDPAWIARAAPAAFEALASVHAAGAVHGDVSPANVLVAPDASRAVLVDFGLALAPRMPPMPPGPFRGTLAFAAPEAARGEPLDARADVFSLAASVLFAACGVPPRAGTEPAAVLLSAAEQPIDAWALRAASTLEPELGRALVACCAFDPGERLLRLGPSPLVS